MSPPVWGIVVSGRMRSQALSTNADHIVIEEPFEGNVPGDGLVLDSKRVVYSRAFFKVGERRYRMWVDSPNIWKMDWKDEGLLALIDADPDDVRRCEVKD